jgi:hypothetical protein
MVWVCHLSSSIQRHYSVSHMYLWILKPASTDRTVERKEIGGWTLWMLKLLKLYKYRRTASHSCKKSDFIIRKCACIITFQSTNKQNTELIIINLLPQADTEHLQSEHLHSGDLLPGEHSHPFGAKKTFIQQQYPLTRWSQIIRYYSILFMICKSDKHTPLPTH